MKMGKTEPINQNIFNIFIVSRPTPVVSQSSQATWPAHEKIKIKINSQSAGCLEAENRFLQDPTAQKQIPLP